MSLKLTKRTLILTALFLGAFFLRFSFMSKGPFHCDALDLALCSQATLDTGRLHYEHGTGYPLTVIIGALFVFLGRLFGAADPVVCINLMSVFMGASGVVLFFFVLEKLFGFSAGGAVLSRIQPCTEWCRAGGIPWPVGQDRPPHGEGIPEQKMPRASARGASPAPEIPPPTSSRPAFFQEGSLDWGRGRDEFHRAMFSAVLFLFFIPHLLISTFGKSLTLSICLCLVATIFLLRFCRSQKPRDLLLAGLFLGLCGAARLSDALFAIPLSVLYFSAGRLSWARVRAFAGFAALAFLATTVFYVPFLLEKGLAPLIFIITAPTEAKFLGPFSFILPVSFGWLLYFFNWGGIGLALLGWGFMIAKRGWRPAVFLAVWFLTFSFFYGNISSSGPRYLVIAWMPLIAAQGFLLGSTRGRLFIFSALWAIVVSSAGLERAMPALEFRHHYALQPDFARWVASRTPEDAVILAIDEDIFIQAYGHRATLRRPITCDPSVLEDFFDSRIDPLLRQGRPVYIISTSLFGYDECKVFRRELARRYELALIGRKRNEDWHHAFSRLFIFWEGLYQLRSRP